MFYMLRQKYTLLTFVVEVMNFIVLEFAGRNPRGDREEPQSCVGYVLASDAC